MSDATPRLALDYVLANQAQKHVTVNGDLWRLDALVQMAVVSRAVTTAPSDPEDGQAWILPSAPVGSAWSAFSAGEVVRRDGGLWVAVDTPEGALAWVSDEERLVVRAASGWASLGSRLGIVGPVEALGVGAEPETDVALIVRGEAARFEADAGGDHRLLVNRSAAADTASLVLQTGYDGGAEIGLCGDTGLSLRTSEDGVTWRTAIKADPGGLTGVNTATPAAVLHVVSETTAAPALCLAAYSAGTAGANFTGQKARGTAALPTGVQAGDRLFALYGRGWTSAGALGGNVVAIQMSAAETFTGSAQATSVTFETTAPGSTTRRAVVSFQSNGALRLHPLTAAPSGPAAGDVYFDQTLNQFRGWTGAAWTTLG